MAKKKPSPSRQSELLDTAELVGDAANPRHITDESAGGLRNSLDRFGDLSGIVFNKRTGELVCGHQRMQQIREQWGDRPIDVIDGERDLHGIVIDDRHFFVVRVVDWSRAMQRAANVAANNQRIAGEFTEDLSSYLLEVEAALAAEAPGLLDELLLVELLAMEIDDTGEEAADENAAQISESYQIIVQCRDEAHQKEVYQQLNKKGLTCKVLTL